MFLFSKKYLTESIPAASLVAFRIFFGLLMALSMTRFLIKGWVKDFYIDPAFHFSYYGFSWVRPLPANGMYLVFLCLIVFSLLIAVGLFYRASMIAFFLLFTYVELIEKSTYLNHYYFISLLSFLLIFIPLHANGSLDRSFRKKKISGPLRVHLYAIRFQVSIVYFFAGLAKIRHDWLFEAQPLKTWLQSYTDFPVIGSLFSEVWFPYSMSWSGMIFDLSIPFIMMSRFRKYGFLAIVFFHVFTWKLFHIGMFPWIMIFSSSVFFETKWPHKIKAFGGFPFLMKSDAVVNKNNRWLSLYLFPIFFLPQLIIPLRSYWYEGDDAWNGSGYRFSWKVMLVEKTGMLSYRIQSSSEDFSIIENPSNSLCLQQAKILAIEPDMILEYAHFLGQKYKDKGYEDIEVYADSYLAMNGRRSQRFVDPAIDLLMINSYWGKPIFILDEKL